MSAQKCKIYSWEKYRRGHGTGEATAPISSKTTAPQISGRFMSVCLPVYDRQNVTGYVNYMFKVFKTPGTLSLPQFQFRIKLARNNRKREYFTSITSKVSCLFFLIISSTSSSPSSILLIISAFSRERYKFRSSTFETDKELNNWMRCIQLC